MSSIKFLKSKIKDLQLNSDQLAEHLHVNKKCVEEWLEGNKKIPYIYLWMLCDLLNIDISDVISLS
jgi:DNA-binding transcriptional regulator YiaG